MKPWVRKIDGRWCVLTPWWGGVQASVDTWREAFRIAEAYAFAGKNDLDTAPGWY